MDSVILHVDMDAFFAAVEVREDPALEGRPVIVGADPEGGHGRGVVAAASYEAREFGVHSAMPISEAWERCSHAEFLRPRGDVYARVSRRIFDILGDYTDRVEPLSIDEAFLDVTGSRRLFGTGEEIAAEIREGIREQESLTASVGVATSKFVAKIASDLEKPDGLVVVPPGTEEEFLAPLPVSRLWGAGPRAQETFAELGLETVGEVATVEPELLVEAFGDAAGRSYRRLARGIDRRAVEPESERKSLGKEHTFGRDREDREVVERTLLRLCETVARRLRGKGLAGLTVTVKLRWDGFETVTRQTTLEEAVDTVERIWPAARSLFREADRPESRRVRLIGVSVSRFPEEPNRQLGLFDEGEEPADDQVAEAVDRLADRYGPGSITRAALLERDPADD